MSIWVYEHAHLYELPQGSLHQNLVEPEVLKIAYTKVYEKINEIKWMNK